MTIQTPSTENPFVEEKRLSGIIILLSDFLSLPIYILLSSYDSVLTLIVSCRSLMLCSFFVPITRHNIDISP